MGFGFGLQGLQPCLRAPPGVPIKAAIRLDIRLTIKARMSYYDRV